MLIDKGAISEFQTLYLKQYHKKMMEAEALEHGRRLIGLVKAVYGNDPYQLKAIDRMYGKEKN